MEDRSRRRWAAIKQVMCPGIGPEARAKGHRGQGSSRREYPGAVCHILSRGNYRHEVVGAHGLSMDVCPSRVFSSSWLIRFSHTLGSTAGRGRGCCPRPPGLQVSGGIGASGRAAGSVDRAQHKEDGSLTRGGWSPSGAGDRFRWKVLP